MGGYWDGGRERGDGNEVVEIYGYFVVSMTKLAPHVCRLFPTYPDWSIWEGTRVVVSDVILGCVSAK
jgi:hypothetical protein